VRNQFFPVAGVILKLPAHTFSQLDALYKQISLQCYTTVPNRTITHTLNTR